MLQLLMLLSINSHALYILLFREKERPGSQAPISPRARAAMRSRHDLVVVLERGRMHALLMSCVLVRRGGSSKLRFIEHRYTFSLRRPSRDVCTCSKSARPLVYPGAGDSFRPGEKSSRHQNPAVMGSVTLPQSTGTRLFHDSELGINPFITGF